MYLFILVILPSAVNRVVTTAGSMLIKARTRKRVKALFLKTTIFLPMFYPGKALCALTDNILALRFSRLEINSRTLEQSVTKLTKYWKVRKNVVRFMVQIRSRSYQQGTRIVEALQVSWRGQDDRPLCSHRQAYVRGNLRRTWWRDIA